MVYEVENMKMVENLFSGWNETMILSCLQKIMGKVYVADYVYPRAAMAFAGCFAFLTGEPNEELVRNKPADFVIMTPQNDEWAKLIEKCYKDNAKKVTRYAIKKETRFDTNLLEKYVGELPEGYSIRFIDGDLYDLCLENDWSEDFVSSFESKEHFLKNGIGVLIFKEDRPVSGASSYSAYEGGIEIEVDTVPEERRKHLATIASASLILECLKRGLYPSWDAQNTWSVALAQKLGYELDHEYIAYEINRN